MNASDGWLTYRELDERANALAHHLRSLGTDREAAVAVCLRRTTNLVVALFAVFKAGAAYVPIDPDYPAERIIYLMRDSAAHVLLTQEDVRLDAPENTSVVLMDSWREWTEQAPEVVVEPDNLAYIIYTSGSTGLPKGVMIEHRQVVDMITWPTASSAPRSSPTSSPRPRSASTSRCSSCSYRSPAVAR